MKLKYLAAACMAAAIYSCDDTTTGVGDFLANTDEINAYSMTFEATTRTIKYTEINEDGVYSRTKSAYLGKFTDADFGTFSANFITQINCPEEFSFPETIKGITESTLELYYSSYYGDSLAPMRVRVDMLTQPINDDGTNPAIYYTSYDWSEYYKTDGEALAEKDYSAYDNMEGDSLYNETGYRSLTINLDNNNSYDFDGDDKDDNVTFSQHLFNKYTEDKNNYKDAYSFINKVLPGFYVHTVQGEGSVLYIGDIWLRTTVEYTIKGSQGQDSTVYTRIPFSATREVFMSTHLENSSDDKLNNLIDDNQHTYLKTPVGLLTEVKLPLNDMFDKLSGDTLNSVSISFTKMKEISSNSGQNPYKMGIPQYLLLIRKNEVNDFFEQNKTYDSRTSFLASYDSSTNTYTFSQLNRLVSQIFSDIRTKEEPTEGWDEYNSLVLVPVETETDSQDNIIGLSHDLEVNSARLIGGEQGEKLKVEVIYTRPAISE